MNGGHEHRGAFGFSHAARFASGVLGSGAAFVTACAAVVVWAVAGPFVGYSDSWQLAINTGTTLVTFLMVFLIQNTQNREAQATQLKLDELIRSIKRARNKLIDLENSDDDDLAAVQREFEALKEQVDRARRATERG
jgi:low affinity Fe/Cu permease